MVVRESTLPLPLLLIHVHKSKGKTILVQALRGTGIWGNENRKMKVVSVSTVSTGHLYPHEIFLVLISVTD